MNTNIFVWLMLVSACLVINGRAAEANIHDDRNKRSVQFIFEGIIDAITQKHSRTTPPTRQLPFTGYTKQGFSVIKNIEKTTLKPTVIATLTPPIRNPTSEARVLSRASTNEASRKSSKNASPNEISGSSRIILSLGNASQLHKTTSTTTIKPPTTTMKLAKIITPPPTEPSTTFSIVSAIQDKTEVPTSAAVTSSIPVEVEIETEERSSKKIRSDQSEPLQGFHYQPTRVLSDRNTQYWGNPLIFRPEYPQLIPFGPYYGELVYNDVNPGNAPLLDYPPASPPPPPPPPRPPLPPPPPGPPILQIPAYAAPLPTIPPKTRPFYLPPGPPVFVLPVPVAPSGLLFRHAGNSHSPIKLNENDYHQYVYQAREANQNDVQTASNALADVNSPQKETAQATLVRHTYIDPYINLESHSQNLIESQSQIVANFQAPQPTVRTSTVRQPNVRQQPSSKTRSASRARLQNPLVGLQNSAVSIPLPTHKSPTLQRPNGQHNSAASGLRQFTPQQNQQHVQNSLILPQIHTQYFGRRTN